MTASQTTGELLSHAERISQLGCFEWNLATNVVRWSEQLYRIYGLLPGEFEPSYENYLDLVVPEDRDQVVSTLQQALDRGGEFTSVKRIRHSSGEIRYIESSGEVVSDEDGHPLQIVGVCRDVTERVEHQQERDRQIERLRLLADYASEVMTSREDQKWHPLFSKLAKHVCSDAYTCYALQEGRLHLKFSEGLPPAAKEALQHMEVGQYPCGAVVSARELLTFNSEDITSNPQCAELKQLGFTSYVGVPLISSGVVLGTIAFGSKELNEFSHADQEFVRSAGQLIAAAMAQDYYAGQIEEREIRLRELLDSAADALLFCDREGWLFDANRMACQSLGYTKEELLKLNIADVQTRSPEFIERIRQEILDGVPVHQYEGEHKRKDGTTFPVEVRVTALKQDGNDVILGSVRDISSRKEMERAKQHADETSNRILEHARMVKWEADAATLDFDYLRGSCADLLGFSEAQWRQPGFLKRQAIAENAKQLPQRFAAASRQDEVVEFPLLHADGREIWVESTVEAVQDPNSGRVIAFRGMMSDVTARKELQSRLRQSQKMEAVGRLAGGVAHDFNNLLTVITTRAELIGLTNSRGEQFQESVDAIKEAAQRAGGLTSQLLMFGRSSLYRPQYVDLNKVLSRCHNILESLMGEKIRLDLELDGQLPSVRTDHRHLDQVLINLAVNARDAMRERGGVLTLKTSQTEVDSESSRRLDVPSGEYVVLEVTDSGDGMSDEVRAKAFEPFYTTKPVGQGSGLGLAVVYGVVKEAHGTIEIIDRMKECGECGTIFRVYLPAFHRVAEESTERLVHNSVGGESILLVEDDDSVRRVASEALKRHGYHVIEARDPDQARNIVRAYDGSIAMLLTDMVMPGDNGLELAESINEILPGIRVLCMSGYSHEGIKRQDSAHGFLQKPFTIKKLVSKVREVLDS